MNFSSFASPRFVFILIMVSFSILSLNSVAKNNDTNAVTQKNNLLPIKALLNRDINNLIRQGKEVSVDNTLNIPAFLWIKPTRFIAEDASELNSTELETKIAVKSRSLISQLAAVYKMRAAALSALKLVQLHNTGRGAIIATFKQYFQNKVVFGHKLSIVFNQQLQPLSISGFVAPKAPQHYDFQEVTNRSPAILSKVFSDLTGEKVAVEFWQAITPANQRFKHKKANPSAIKTVQQKVIKWQLADNTNLNKLSRLRRNIRTKSGWYLNTNGFPEAVLDIEIAVSKNQNSALNMKHYLVALESQAITKRTNLTRKANKTYRVWADSNLSKQPFNGPQGNSFFPHPTGQDDDTLITMVNSNLVTLNSAPFSRNDPWLSANSNITSGNNVHAYVDRDSPDGFSALTADHFATETSPATFDYLYNFVADPNTNSNLQNAAIVQAFYVANYIHDWIYDAGFNESTGNAQQDNYGRGGSANDPMLVEIQDFADRNNANMATPADGGSPVMQVFLWDGSTQHQAEILAPANLAGTLITGAAQFGPRDFDITQQLVLVKDGITDPNEPDSTLYDACEVPFLNAAELAGKIAVIDRGVCFFVEKISRAEAEGAIGVIIINQKTDGVVTMGPGDNPPPINIPALMVSKADGAPIRAALLNAEILNARLMRTTDVDKDAGLESSLLIHEWGHFLNNRLVTISSKQSQGMDEGWSDFLALLALTRAEDVANIDGAFAISVYSTNRKNAAYFGIRRAPYSTNMNINGLTFKHIADGEPLPTTMPVAFGSDGAKNSQVHATGEIWASMLWEGYVGLIKDSRHTFSQAQSIMKDYLVASLIATPADPNFIEARDALLSVVAARDAADSQTFLDGFAKRGLGIGAVAPLKTSDTNANPIESFDNNNPAPPPPPPSTSGGGGGAISWLLLLIVFRLKRQ